MLCACFCAELVHVLQASLDECESGQEQQQSAAAGRPHSRRVMEGSIPFARAEVAAGSAAASAEAARSPAQRGAPAALGEALDLTLSRPSIPASDAAEVDRGADHGGLSSDTAAESGSKAVAPSVGQPEELNPSSAPLEKGKQSAAM